MNLTKFSLYDKLMKKPEFIEKHLPGRFEYHLPVPYERFISSTLFDNSEFNLEKEVFNDLISFTTDSNISSLIGWDENAILYSIALKALATQKECYRKRIQKPT